MALHINLPRLFNPHAWRVKAMISGQYMYFACILRAMLRDILRGMNEKTQSSKSKTTPKGVDLEKIEVRLLGETKRRLESAADRDHRSGNKQAVHYIESCLNGVTFDDLARKIDNIESLLIEVLRRMDEK